jgi:hypothetical protein
VSIGDVVVGGRPRVVDLQIPPRPGPPGPPGPPGKDGTGDLHYVHTQGTPSAVWTVQHDLGKWGSVTVLDSANSWLLTDVEYLDENTLVITLAAPASGKALVN